MISAIQRRLWNRTPQRPRNRRPFDWRRSRRRNWAVAASESLEVRCLLSGTGLATVEHTFEPDDSDVQVRLNVDSVNTNDAIFQIEATPTDGSDASVGPLEYRNQLNVEVTSDGELSSTDGSRTELLTVAPGQYDIRVTDQNASSGGVSLTVDLVGDASGDGSIGSEDIGAILDDLFSAYGSFAQRIRNKISDAQEVSPDANLDGKVDFEDFEVLMANQGVSVSGVTLTVLPDNTAPTLDNSGDPAMDPLSEALLTNNGITVADLLSRGANGAPIEDTDAGAVDGIAVVGELLGSGTYEFDASGGTDFLAFESTSIDSATLLAPTARIRFVPNSTFSGTLINSLFFRAWDQTLGSNGATGVSTAFNGGESAFSTEIETVSVTVEPVELALDFTQNTFVESNETLITRNATFVIDGTTVANSTVEIDSDGDGDFDDGTATASETGEFSFTVTLTHDSSNFGSNTVSVRTTGPNLGLQTIVEQNVHLAEGTIVRFDTSLGSFDIELLDDAAPNTVANFLNYSERYANSIIHRSVSNFVIQGGGFDFDANADPTLDNVATDPSVDNEFSADNLNLRGTLSTAQQSGDINSFTSQWFINVVDNAFLDDVPHTVFGRVIGSGMDLVDEINSLTTFNLNGTFAQTALTDVPLTGYFGLTQELTGTVSVSTGGTLVNGVGTQFTTEILANGGTIEIGGEIREVQAVLNDQQLLLAVAHTAGATNETARINSEPDDNQYVLFQSIDTILDPVP